MNIIVASVTIVIVALIAWRTYLAARGLSSFVPYPIHTRAVAYRAKRRGCVEGRFCKLDRGRHQQCVHCGQVTCARMAYIDYDTHRRRVGPVCHRHLVFAPVEQRRLQEQRTRDDWQKLTDPIDASRLNLGQLPEQYPGPSRATLRAFLDSDAEQATVRNLKAEVLQQSIVRLKLTDELYAEQRGHHTVLRRVTPTAQRTPRSKRTA